MDWDKIQRSIFSIDVSNELADHPLKFRRISQSRARDLNHDDVTDPFRVVAQEFFKSAQLQQRENQRLGSASRK